MANYMTTFQTIILCLALLRFQHFCADAAVERGESKSNTQRQWKPRNQFWKHILEEQVGLEDGNGEQFDNIELCLNMESTLSLLNNNEVLQDYDSAPVVVDTLTDSMNRTILVEVANAITPLQVQAIKDLAACAQEYFPNTRLEHRHFEYFEGTGGGNDCTFINILLQIFLPQVYEKVVQIAELAHETARWGKQLNLQPPSTCGLRTSEYLDYGKFRGLGGHEDAGSIYTALFALSDSKGYRGGEYYIRPRNEPNNRKYYFKPRQYSAIVFLSETHHGVTDIESGTREMFTNEFWEYDDPPWTASRRSANGAMDIFTKRCAEELDDPIVMRDDHYHRGEDIERLWHESHGLFENDDSEDNDSRDDDDHLESHGLHENGDSGDDDDHLVVYDESEL